METVTDQQLSRPSTYDQSTHVVKGKRTKRTRPQSPFMAASSLSASLSGDDRNYCNTGDFAVSPATSAVSPDGGATEEEEHDLANCLILLAQGSSKEPPPMQDTGENDDTKLLLGQRLTEPATTTTTATATGKYLYECKTCNRSFPSFQALGGHRASHKKTKLAAVGSGVGEEESQVSCLALQAYKHGSSSSPYNSSNAAKSRVHECSICGAEFSSGQALGGHKRRHRAAMATAGESVVPPESKKQRSSALSLDLNLPAPEEDPPSSPRSFTFAGKQTLVFAATPLAAMRPMVDCHY